ncbi:MAG: glycosyltransferase [Cyanobacteriota bacterium]|jgi:tetratricopeptide (TPR) repeat protein
MTRLSLCMIVRDEAERLPQCLASVQDWVEEIVVADTGSTDETRSIAERAGARVLSIPWQDDFSLARNQALEAAQGDWILVLDGDEIFNPRLRESVDAILNQETALVVNLLRQELGAAQSPYSAVSRLFRRHPEIRFSRPYHETIDDSVLALLQKQPHWQVIDLPGVAIRHWGYSPEALAAKNKTQRAQVLLEKALGANPQDAYLCSKLGALYYQIGRDKDGFKLLKQGLKSNLGSAPVRYELHYHLANAYNREGKWELALKHYQKALQENLLLPLKLGALNNYGALLNQLGQYPQARQVFENVVHIDPSFLMGYLNLGLTLKAQKRYPQAIEVYQRAIKLNPQWAPAHQNLGVAYFQARQLQASLAAFKTAIALYQRQGNPQADVLRRELQALGMLAEENEVSQTAAPP